MPCYSYCPMSKISMIIIVIWLTVVHLLTGSQMSNYRSSMSHENSFALDFRELLFWTMSYVQLQTSLYTSLVQSCTWQCHCKQYYNVLCGTVNCNIQMMLDMGIVLTAQCTHVQWTVSLYLPPCVQTLYTFIYIVVMISKSKYYHYGIILVSYKHALLANNHSQSIENTIIIYSHMIWHW